MSTIPSQERMTNMGTIYYKRGTSLIMFDTASFNVSKVHNYLITTSSDVP